MGHKNFNFFPSNIDVENEIDTKIMKTMPTTHSSVIRAFSCILMVSRSSSNDTSPFPIQSLTHKKTMKITKVKRLT